MKPPSTQEEPDDCPSLFLFIQMFQQIISNVQIYYHKTFKRQVF